MLGCNGQRRQRESLDERRTTASRDGRGDGGARADLSNLARGHVRNVAARNDLNQETATELQTRTSELQTQMQNDQWVAAKIFSVMLPPSMVIIDAASAAHDIQDWPTYFEGVQPPDADIPPLPAAAAPVEIPANPAVPDQHFPALVGVPEDQIQQLENQAQDVRNAYELEDSLNVQAVSRRDGVQQKEADIQVASDQEKQAANNAVSMHESFIKAQHQVSYLNDVLTAATDTFAVQVAESAIWDVAKHGILVTIRQEYRELLTGKLDLTDQETFDYYAAHKTNIFQLPDTIEQVRDLKAVQNNIIALLAHAEDYADLAVQLMARSSPTEINDFANGIYKGMQDDSSALVKSSLNAAEIPEPFKSIVRKYIVNAGNEKSASELLSVAR